jgi:UDP-N-acetylglucosamine:LPS N-acetylglucosamine transferase
LKICLAASSGGHFEQIMQLSSLAQLHDICVITEKTDCNQLEMAKTYYLSQVNRREFFSTLKLIWNTICSLVVFVKEKPDVVISTGALSTVPICLIAKWFKRKLIFIESFAKVTTGTKTGSMMYKLADRFYVQWEGLQAVYPDAIFAGSVYKILR